METPDLFLVSKENCKRPTQGMDCDVCMACGSGASLLLTQAEPRLQPLGAIEALASWTKQSPADFAA